MHHSKAPTRVLAFALPIVLAGNACSDGTTNPGGDTPTLLARRAHGMAFDADRNRVVLFGGIGPATSGAADTDQRSLWAWSGTAWTLVSDGANGPSARNHQAMAYDVARARLVIMGGRQGDSPVSPALNDTWEWNGTAWSQAAAQLPAASARSHSGAAYDPARQHVVLAGGINAGGNDVFDQYEWTGAAWTAIAGTIPGGNFAPTLVADGQQLVLLQSRVTDRQLLTYNANTGGTWAAAGTTGPTLTGYAVAPLATGGLILFGGFDGTTYPSDTWKWNGTTWTRVSTTGPAGRVGHAMALDRARSRVVLYGGESPTTKFADTWEFDGTTWTRVGG